MAYTMTESPVDYDAAQKYIRYRGLRKGSARSDYDAQAASFDVNYNLIAEQNTSRYKDSRQPVYSENVPLLSNMQVPSAATNEQHSLSNGQWSKSRRMGNIGYERLNEAQQEACQKLTGEANRTEDVSKERSVEEGHRKETEEYNEEIRWDPAEIYDDYAASLQEPEVTSIDTSHEATPKDKPLSYGLPSNPRPDPHYRKPSMEQNGRMDSHLRNVSVARNDIPDTYHRNPSIGRNEVPDPHQRNPSIGKNEMVNPYQRNPSVDRHGMMNSHQRNPSVSRNDVSDSIRQTPSKERNEIPESYRSQDSYRFNGGADMYQRKPSDSERKGSSSSRKGSSDSRKGSTDSHKGGSISQSGSRTATRKVKITCDQISFSLAFTPTTTAKDVLTIARDRLGEGFDQKRYILVESYKQLGSERPLRHFERISDVLDTWDADDKDALLIQPFHAQWEYESLDLENAPKLVPSNMTANLYYSHRPESWHKWSFTLRVDGQIVMQKYSGGDYKAICHMNDFDIYIPTSRQMKKLAPPRKFCFAIKSQQKAILSADNSNFVHFFSTNDKDVASEWYRAVHSWRSYYITHNKGRGKSSSVPLSQPSSLAELPRRNASLPGGNQRKGSTDKPLPEINRALISTTNNEYKPFDIRADPFARPINPNHNRSVSADRYGSSPWNHSQGPVISADSINTTNLPEQVHGTRRHHQVAKSDTVLSTSQSSFAKNGLSEGSQTMRKQSSEPPYSARAIVHPYRYGKPSVEFTRERKLSDDLNSDPHMAGGPAPPGWKFDPYTGQPLTAALPMRSNGLNSQQDTTGSMQKHAYREGYGGVEPMDRKFSHEASISVPYAVNGHLQQEHQLPYRNRDFKGSITEATQNGVYISNIKAEAIHEITTRTGEQFF